jgi:putative PEP-CTERM system TPR-repeat lipoprotein
VRYTKATALRPDSAPAQFNLAGAQLASGNVKAAEASYRKAIALDNDFPDAQTALAVLLVRTKRESEALKIARDLQMRYPKLSSGPALESDVLFAQKNYAGALKAAEKALALDKTSSNLLLKAYTAQARGGDVSGALGRLSKWLNERPEDFEVRSMLADGLLATGNARGAAEHYEYIRSRIPGDALSRNNLAIALHRINDQRAVELAEEAHKLVPDNPLVADTLGWILVDRNEVKRGLELLRQAAGKLPEHAEVRYHLAIALAKSGDNAAARKELESLLKSGKPFPGMAEARQLLGKL